MRRKGGVDNSARDGVTLRLAYRPPYDWPGMLAALAARATPATEWIEDDVWHRRIELDGSARQRRRRPPAASAIRSLVTIRFPSVQALPGIVARVRRVFDLGADIVTIDSHLARDPKLAPLIAKRPGLRAPGDWERETMVDRDAEQHPPAWRPWHAYAAQHLRMASHG